MKKSELTELVKKEILAEAKKKKQDKTGLAFALAANIEKYGKPQTPKGAKSTHFTKKQEKQVKKTAEKLKKSIKENVSPMALANALAQGGYIKDEWMFGKKASSAFGFRVKEILDNLEGITELKEDLGNYMFFQIGRAHV